MASIVNWTLGNKLQWNFNRNSNIFIQENVFENGVCEMPSICLGLNVLNQGYPGTCKAHKGNIQEVTAYGYYKEWNLVWIPKMNSYMWPVMRKLIKIH